MLHDLLGIALISVGALTMVARVMGRAQELRRGGSRGLPHLTAKNGRD